MHASVCRHSGCQLPSKFLCFFFFIITGPPPSSPLFPTPTLSRSMLGVVLRVARPASRRTAALVGLAVACLTVPRASAAQQPQLPRSPAEKAWDRHDLRRARVEIGRAHV